MRAKHYFLLVLPFYYFTSFASTLNDVQLSDPNPKVVILTELMDVMKIQLLGNADFMRYNSALTSQYLNESISLEDQLDSVLYFANNNLSSFTPIVSNFVISKGYQLSDFSPSDISEFYQSMISSPEGTISNTLPCAAAVRNYVTASFKVMEAGFMLVPFSEGITVPSVSVKTAALILAVDDIYCDCVRRVHGASDCGRN